MITNDWARVQLKSKKLIIRKMWKKKSGRAIRKEDGKRKNKKGLGTPIIYHFPSRPGRNRMPD